jgi:hypothetical protein
MARRQIPVPEQIDVLLVEQEIVGSDTSALQVGGRHAFGRPAGHLHGEGPAAVPQPQAGAAATPGA